MRSPEHASFQSHHATHYFRCVRAHHAPRFGQKSQPEKRSQRACYLIFLIAVYSTYHTDYSIKYQHPREACYLAGYIGTNPKNITGGVFILRIIQHQSENIPLIRKKSIREGGRHRARYTVTTGVYDNRAVGV